MEFKKCRDWFIYRGEMLLNNRACQNSDPPTNKKCYSLHQQLPELRNISSIIQSGKEKVELCSSYSLCKKNYPTPLSQVKCFPSERVETGRNSGWCAVCLPGAKPGKPGYCSPEKKNLKVRDQLCPSPPPHLHKTFQKC